MAFVNHPPVFGLLFGDVLVLPSLPVDLALAFDILFHDEFDNFSFVILLAAHATDLQLQQLHELVPAVENSLILHFVTNLLPVDVLHSNGIEALVHVSAHHLVVMELESL